MSGSISKFFVVVLLFSMFFLMPIAHYLNYYSLQSVFKSDFDISPICSFSKFFCLLDMICISTYILEFAFQLLLLKKLKGTVRLPRTYRQVKFWKADYLKCSKFFNLRTQFLYLFCFPLISLGNILSFLVHRYCIYIFKIISKCFIY